MEHVILVDDDDTAIGFAPKQYVHEHGLLHRAFSVFIFRSTGELLLQQRAFGKYHSGGQWTNTCCGHPRPHEDIVPAAKRRLEEEMGMSCELNFLVRFSYRAPVGNGLTEHEIDHVLVGVSDDIPAINPNEVAEWRAAEMHLISDELRTSPRCFTPWFRIIFQEVYAYAQPRRKRAEA
jgi:isopentenyl-diphosphate Delta-isomerase